MLHRYGMSICIVSLVYCTLNFAAATEQEKEENKAQALKFLTSLSSSPDRSTASPFNPEIHHIIGTFALTTAPIGDPFIGSLLARLDALFQVDKVPLKIASTLHGPSRWTLFHTAVLHKLPQLVRKLSHSENINVPVDQWRARFIQQPIDNVTALHIAAHQADIDTARVLLQQKGIRHNRLNGNGDAPLHMIPQILPSSKDVSQLAKLLVNHGCCLKLKCNGLTALKMAEKRSHSAKAILTSSDCVCSRCSRRKTPKSHSRTKTSRTSLRTKRRAEASSSSSSSASSSSSSSSSISIACSSSSSKKK